MSIARTSANGIDDVVMYSPVVVKFGVLLAAILLHPIRRDKLFEVGLDLQQACSDAASRYAAACAIRRHSPRCRQIFFLHTGRSSDASVLPALSYLTLAHQVQLKSI